MKKILLINAYFGKLPNYFDIWLKSAYKNPTINFLIVTDDKTQYDYPSNVKIIYTSFEIIRDKIKKIFNFNNKIEETYKLCDYKPFYNKIFADEVKNYDFWGYSDLDLVFGDIRKFVTEELLEKYDKIYTRGHFTLLKNSSYVNDIIITNKKSSKYSTYLEALKTNYPCHFDEWGGVSAIFSNSKLNQYDEIDFCDLNYKMQNFQMLFKEQFNFGIFEWDDGKLYFIDENNKLEVMYAHFQKKDMINKLSNIKCEKFVIIPNLFVDYDSKYVDNIKEYMTADVYTEYRRKRINVIKNKIKNGAIHQRVYNMIKKIIYK